jgi:ubiquinone/menaquinone biosynthesis C-methylase UbiE
MTNNNFEHVEYFDRLAAKRQKLRKRHKYYWKDISRYCSFYIQPESSVIEIGCGCGELLDEIDAGYRVGIDFSGGMINRAKQKFPGYTFYQMEAKDIRLDEKFDVVIISNVLGYIDDVQAVFTQVRKLCHRNTRLIINDYSHLWEPLLKFAEFLGLKVKTPQQNWLSYQDVKNILYLEDFELYKRTQRMLIPFNIPVISWLFNRYIARLPVFRNLCINQFYTARLMEYARVHDNVEYSVSVVVPARNEAGNIENAVTRLPRMGIWTEIIFVEGNSTDNTWEVIQQISEKYKDTTRIKIARQDGRGKGDAVRKGFSLAEGDILMILDADLTVPPEDLPKFYNALATGKGEFINGSRLVYPLDKDSMRFLNMLGNKFFSVMFSWLLGQRLKDTLCGTKVITKADYEKLIANRKYFGEFDPFGDFDLIFGAAKLNLRIVEIPIRYRARAYGETNISRFKHGWLLLKMVFFAMNKIKFI